jgi:hypothetical protein
MASKLKFVAASAAATQRDFFLFPRFCVDNAKATFERHFKVYRAEMRGRATTGPLYKNTGRLGGSFDREVSGGVLSQLRASVFSRSSYAVVHERGGTVFPPVGSTWIYIPTVYNALYTLRAHVRRPKKTVRQVRSEGGRYLSTKQFVNEFPDARRTLSLMDFVSKSLLIDATGMPMYTLWTRARYEARLKFIETGLSYEPAITADLAREQTDYWKAG